MDRDNTYRRTSFCAHHFPLSPILPQPSHGSNSFNKVGQVGKVHASHSPLCTPSLLDCPVLIIQHSAFHALQQQITASKFWSTDLKKKKNGVRSSHASVHVPQRHCRKEQLHVLMIRCSPVCRYCQYLQFNVISRPPHFIQLEMCCSRGSWCLQEVPLLQIGWGKQFSFAVDLIRLIQRASA